MVGVGNMFVGVLYRCQSLTLPIDDFRSVAVNARVSTESRALGSALVRWPHVREVSVVLWVVVAVIVEVRSITGLLLRCCSFFLWEYKLIDIK